LMECGRCLKMVFARSRSPLTMASISSSNLASTIVWNGNSATEIRTLAIECIRAYEHASHIELAPCCLDALVYNSTRLLRGESMSQRTVSGKIDEGPRTWRAPAIGFFPLVPNPFMTSCTSAKENLTKKVTLQLTSRLTFGRTKRNGSAVCAMMPTFGIWPSWLGEKRRKPRNASESSGGCWLDS
jgi:hypothetical protein